MDLDFDIFFYYGKNDLDTETYFDILQGVVQSKRSLFYNRQDGAGVPDYENYPNGLSFIIQLRYLTALWFAYRNSVVSDGTNNLPDRRVATSQNLINVIQDKGNSDISIQYIPYANYTKQINFKFNLGGF